MLVKLIQLVLHIQWIPIVLDKCRNSDVLCKTETTISVKNMYLQKHSINWMNQSYSLGQNPGYFSKCVARTDSYLHDSSSCHVFRWRKWVHQIIDLINNLESFDPRTGQRLSSSDQGQTIKASTGNSTWEGNVLTSRDASFSRSKWNDTQKTDHRIHIKSEVCWCRH